MFYAVGSAASGWCASSSNKINNGEGDTSTIPPSEGDLFTVCGISNVVGGATTGGGYAVSTVCQLFFCVQETPFFQKVARVSDFIRSIISMC